MLLFHGDRKLFPALVCLCVFDYVHAKGVTDNNSTQTVRL